jgi:hypothetical protein
MDGQYLSFDHGDQDHVQQQGSFLANLSLRPDATRYRLEMGTKRGKKCDKSAVHTAALDPRNPWLSPGSRGGGAWACAWGGAGSRGKGQSGRRWE